jgi:hypothetical protein
MKSPLAKALFRMIETTKITEKNNDQQIKSRA